MDLSEATYRVSLRTRDEDVHQAISAAKDLILVGGHGVGVAPPGGPLPEVDTWGIYAKATSAEEAQRMVEDAVAGLKKVAVVVDVQPFSAE
jgi:hypothetical protein